MTYLALCLLFLAASGIVAAIAWPRAPRGHAAALAIAAAALVVLTAVFDTVMIAAGLFAYADEHLAGPHLGLAPIEDFAYPIAALLLASAAWNLLVPAETEASDGR
ncbi:lycopene cyclase domain-containing protein [Agromyces intestinalis]|uniref:Lycopene cyclase domain-containing protein n=1 Tax=Agromyces intestinalis TaxID=2592652 RepID=A0A5C1YDY9_9MICO|nr:lycopene cyclase domain-containing protein [Agromyces intestinalis]QEO14331.1 lycopene cyclase domain-containing protein [Agromyces intestinalis]